jgi:TFIIF-interacting CTD phosphatase-like protein
MKKTNIILDLDETVISAVPSENAKESKELVPSKTKHFSLHDMDGYYVVFERPNLQKFLDYIFEHFNVSVWTAATKEYALFIIDKIILRKNRKLDFIFFSYHCSWSKKIGKGTKDLSLLWKKYNIPNYNENNTLIIDDYDHVSEIQPNNCLVAVPFDVLKENSENDDYLERLQKELECLRGGECDVTVESPRINSVLSPKKKD